jgi:hypothetical protein
MTTLWALGALSAILLGLGFWKRERLRELLRGRRGERGSAPIETAALATISDDLALSNGDPIESDVLALDIELGRNRIETLLRSFAPVRIHLTPYDDDTRFIEIGEPEEVSMIPDRGIYVRAAGMLRYKFAGVELERDIRSVELVLEPIIVGESRSSRLVFDIEILRSDIVGVPSVLDQAVVNKVNGRLDWKHTKLTWSFGQTLTTSITIPERIEPLDQLLTHVGTSRVHIGHDGIRLEVGIVPTLTRLRAQPTDDRQPTAVSASS